MQKNKVFLITIDTEGDNQWAKDSKNTTKNTKFLPRFQELAEKYNFKPVWLTNYEMANDEEYVKYMKKKQDNNLCEIGMHLHAWNNPPEYELNRINQEKDYLIEYPKEIMDKKIKNITNLIEKKFGKKPVSHRSGRWTMNDDYFELLDKYGYLIDCSVTPHVSWEVCPGSTGLKGSNYSNYPEEPYFYKDTKILEVPVTIRKCRKFEFKCALGILEFINEAKNLVFGYSQWIRPNRFTDEKIRQMKKVIDSCEKNEQYIMFMIHSSELMPGGSPNFKTKEDIEKLYKVIEAIFSYAKSKGYIGMTLKEYYDLNK